MILILGAPRTGTSLFARILSESGIKTIKDKSTVKMNSYSFNPDGYFENNLFNLLNDQLIRIFYGKKSSFLYVRKRKKLINTSFNYDINEKTIFFPKDFSKRINYYTDNSWDTWALSRMTKDEKWYKCYSKNKIETFKEIMERKDYFKKIINHKYYKNFFLKDPRLSLLLDLYAEKKNVKIIHMIRKEKDLLNSIRKHYGKNLFKKKFIYKNIVSNYFNYKIGYQSFKDYNYYINNHIKKISLNNNISYLRIDYNDLINKKINLQIENFLNRKIDFSCIKN